MPKDGFTVITVSKALKDRLASTAMEMGFKGVPRLLDAFLNGTSNGTSTAKSSDLPPFQNLEPRAGFGPATPALPRRSPTRLGYRGTIAHILVVERFLRFKDSVRLSC